MGKSARIQWLILVVCAVLCGLTSTKPASKSLREMSQTLIDTVAYHDGKIKEHDAENDDFMEFVHDFNNMFTCAQNAMEVLNGRCYLFVNCTSKCDGNQAAAACHDIGATLVAVTSEELNNLIKARLPAGKTVWIGGNGTSGTWKWPNGDLISDGYRHWTGPSNNNPNSFCMYIHAEELYARQWHDEPCASNRGDANGAYVCEQRRVLKSTGDANGAYVCEQRRVLKSTGV